MAPLGPKGDLAIAELAFFAPALLLSVFVVARHGFARQLGWLYLVILSLLRIIGSSCTIYIDQKHSTNSSLLETAYITSAIGTAPLLLVLLGFLTRVNDGITNTVYKLPQRILRLLSLVSLIALILTIVGNDDDSLPIMEAASVLFLAFYVSEVAITALLLSRKHAALKAERVLIYAGLCSLPFLAVRVLYTLLVAFKSNDPGSDFYYRDISVWISALMQFLMEAISVCIFVIAGLVTPRRQVVPSQPRPSTISGVESQGVRMSGHSMK